MLDVFTNICSHENSHGILIVGEGNFSFARDLIAYEKKHHVYATSFDSKEVVHADEFAQINLEEIADHTNATVKHSVDATCLYEYFQDQKFSVIVFNFPHTGGKSNIKKCRRLLELFFKSASDCLCSEGHVIVSLCRGQGGTPADASRGNYKNSWQVSSCASKSGFILSGLLPFYKSSLENYSEAGYRGVIRQKFFTSNGLIHIFKKGEILKITTEKDEFEGLAAMLKGDAEEENEKYVYDRYFQNSGNKLYSKLEEIFVEYVGKLFPEITIDILNVNSIIPPLRDNLQGKSRIYSDSILSSNNGTCELESLPNNVIRYSFYSVDLAADISPYSHHVSHQVNFVWNTQKIGMEYSSAESFILTHLQTSLLKNFNAVVVDCTCNTGNPFACSCIMKGTSWCKPQECSSERNYNVDKVPHFREDIPQSFWTTYQPEIVISYSNEDNEVVYQKQVNHKYSLNKLETNYFKRHSTNLDSKNAKKVLVNGRCIASIWYYTDQVGHHALMLTFFSNEIFVACYSVPELRYIWCKDTIFHNDLLKQMRNDRESNLLTPFHGKYETFVEYPLCYRHDLCFWLDEKHTESQLIECVRLVTGDLLHSMRMIKMLRHEETNSVSYCYRMIYSRLDGSMSHENSVDLQNKLRLFLLHLGFNLR